MEAYVKMIEEALNRVEWEPNDRFWFSPEELDLIPPVWRFFSDNQTSHHSEQGQRVIWLKREDGTPLNVKVRPSYDLYTKEIIGITIYFDSVRTSKEDILKTILYYSKLGKLTLA